MAMLSLVKHLMGVALEREQIFEAAYRIYYVLEIECRYCLTSSIPAAVSLIEVITQLTGQQNKDSCI